MTRGLTCPLLASPSTTFNASGIDFHVCHVSITMFTHIRSGLTPAHTQLPCPPCWGEDHIHALTPGRAPRLAQGQGPIPIYQMMGNCVLPAPMPPPLISILFPNKFGQNPQTTPKALKQTAEFLGLGPLRATSGSEEGRGPSGCVSQSASCRPGRLVECAWGPGLQQEGFWEQDWKLP